MYSNIFNKGAISLFIYIPISHDDNLIYIYCIQEMKIVSNENDSLSSKMPLIDLLAKDINGINI